MVKGKLWLEVVMCANCVLNHCSSKALRVITPCEAWNGRKPMVSHMCIFGCLACAFVSSQQRHKLDEKAKKCTFVGYSSGGKGNQPYHPLTNKIIVSRSTQ